MKGLNWCGCPSKFLKPSVVPPNSYFHFTATVGHLGGNIQWIDENMGLDFGKNIISVDQ